MVTCSQIVDGAGQWKGHAGQGEQASRALVYDVETGSLRYSKACRAPLKALSNSPNPSFTTSSFKGVHEKLGQDSPTQHRLRSEDGSGESSPKCVIRNSAMRSNSSSPTMSTISKASSEPGRRSDDREGRYRGTRRGGTSSPEHDEEASPGAKFPASEPRKIGDARGLKKLGSNTPGRLGLKGPPHRRIENFDSSSAKENGWSVPAHDALSGEVQEAHTAPFKSIQSALADNTMESAPKKPKHGGIPLGKTQSASVMNGSSGIFSFNATYISRAGVDSDLNDSEDAVKEQSDFTRSYVHRTLLGPLLKPTPSKWDDAEKWLACAETPGKTKARSGPLLAHMVASQAGMPIARKAALSAHHERRSGPLTGAGGLSQRSETPADGSAEAVDVKSCNKPLTTGVVGVVVDFTADEKEQLNLLLDRYQSKSGVELAYDGSTSPECNGSFLKMARRVEKPFVEPSPTTGALDSELESEFARIVSTRDMGTAMTPIESVEPSRIGTPTRATTPEKSPDNVPVNGARITVHCDNDADTMSRNETAESPRMLSPRELQEKTRQEILVLGTQLGKTNIAAWAKGEEKESETDRGCTKKDPLDLENIRRSVLATRAAAWEEAEKTKYTSRFQQEKAKIQAWENHEKAKAEAEMRRAEVKAERIKSEAHEKLTNKLEITQRQAEELRLAAETRRTDAAGKTAKRAEALKTNGKFSNLLFLSYLCT